MLGHRALEAHEYLGILRRHVWWIVIPTLVVPMLAYAISLKIPNRFTSQALVLIEEQKVPDAFVHEMVTEDLSERLATMQEQIFSRTRLAPIIERFGLYKEQNLHMEDMLDLMRKAITVAPARSGIFAGNTDGHAVPGFVISFVDSDPRRAQHVCAEITSMFMQENLHAREQRAEGTTDFLKSQLEEAKRKLDDQDAKSAEFKRKYLGQLPGQEQGNFNMLASLRSQLDASTQAISHLQQEKSYAESMLNQQLGALKSLQNSDSPQTLEQQLAAQQTTLVALQTRYTETHPDVMKAKANIAALKKKIDEAESDPEPKTEAKKKAGTLEPQAVQQIRAQLHGVDVALADRAKEQAQVQQAIRSYESKLQLSPNVEEEYKLLTRDSETALKFYNELLVKKTQSEMATDLERRQQGEQFRMMDPPNLPEKPTFPNRPLFAAGGLAGGLVIGLGIAFLLEMKDKSIRNEKDIEHFLDLPTLMLMPRLKNGLRKDGKNAGEKARNRKSEAVEV